MAAGLNYRNYGGEIDETEILSLMQQITYAISWKQIEKAIQGLERMLSYEHKFERYSTLIQKAMEIVRKEYDRGITLEEAASQLYVSEEYLIHLIFCCPKKLLYFFYPVFPHSFCKIISCLFLKLGTQIFF